MPFPILFITQYSATSVKERRENPSNLFNGKKFLHGIDFILEIEISCRFFFFFFWSAKREEKTFFFIYSFETSLSVCVNMLKALIQSFLNWKEKRRRIFLDPTWENEEVRGGERKSFNEPNHNSLIFDQLARLLLPWWVIVS